MGARINFIFDDGSESLIALYSHWGADSWVTDLASAVKFAEPRRGDFSYWVRIVVSQLTKSATDSELGFGLFAISRDELEGLDTWGENLLIDLVNSRISGVPFENFLHFASGYDSLGVSVSAFESLVQV